MTEITRQYLDGLEANILQNLEKSTMEAAMYRGSLNFLLFLKQQLLVVENVPMPSPNTPADPGPEEVNDEVPF